MQRLPAGRERRGQETQKRRDLHQYDLEKPAHQRATGQQPVAVEVGDLEPERELAQGRLQRRAFHEPEIEPGHRHEDRGDGRVELRHVLDVAGGRQLGPEDHEHRGDEEHEIDSGGAGPGPDVGIGHGCLGPVGARTAPGEGAGVARVSVDGPGAHGSPADGEVDSRTVRSGDGERPAGSP